MTQRARCAMTVGLLTLLVPGFAAAQDLQWSATAEAGGDEVYLLFAEPTLLFGPETGLRPFVRVGAHYTIVSDGENSWGLTPAGGLRWQTTGGFIGGSVGAEIAGDDDSFDPFGGGDTGLHTGIHAEFWGDGSWGLQGIANYNWGADFLWSRARATKRIASRSNGGGISLGAELVWQAQADDGDAIEDNEFQATYIGPVLLVNGPRGANWGFSGGLKHTDPLDDDTWYAKVELFLP